MGVDEVRYEELDASVEGSENGTDLGRLQNVPVELAVEIGRTRMTIGDALALAPGSVVTVGRLAGDPVDLLVNGRVIARGEVVAIDEELGLRITEIAAAVVGGGEEDAAEQEPAEPAEPPSPAPQKAAQARTGGAPG